MAGVIGSSGGGYATVNPTQGNPMGEALQNVENSAFKYNAIRRENQQAEAEQQKVLREARDKELKENQAYADKHKISATGISSVDKAALDFSIDNKNLYNVAANTLKNSNDEDERRNALETMSNLESSFEIAKALPEMLNASAKDLEDGVRQGKYNPLSSTNAAKTIEAMSKGDMKVVFKPNGIPTFITYKRDGQGNLSEIIDKEMTMEQLKQKLAPIMAFDSKTNDIDFGKTLGERIETEQGNNIIKQYPNLSDAAEQNANSIVTNRDKMYGVAADAGVTPKTDLVDYTPEEVLKVKKYIKEGLEAKYQPSITTNNAKLSREQTASNQAANNAIAKANLKISQQKADQETNTTTVTESVDPLTGRPIRTETYKKTTKGSSNKKVSPNVASTKAPVKVKETTAKKEEFAYMNNGHIKKEYKIRDIQRTNKGDIGNYDETYFDVKTRKKIENNKVYGIKEIASKAKAAGYTTNEYVALLAKKGIYVIQN